MSTDRYRTLARLLVGVFVVSLPLMDLELFSVGGKSIVLPYVVLLPILGLLVAERHALRTHLTSDTALPFLAGWLAVAVCSGAIAFLRSQDSGLLTANLLQFANIAYMVVHFVALGAALRLHSNAELPRVLDVFIWTACAGAALSVYQVGSVVFGWPYEEWLRTSNLYFKANTLNWHGGGSWIALPRAFGSAPEPTFWAAYLAIGLCFAMVRLYETFRVRFALEAAAISIGLLLTFSRAALPPLAAAFAVWAVSRRGRRQWVVPGLIAAALCITVGPAFIDQRDLTITADLSAVERLSAQVAGLQMASDYPFLGVGSGSVAATIEGYLSGIDGRAGIGFSRLYSFVLIVLATTGVLGTVLFALFLLEVGRRLHAAVSNASESQVRMTALASLVGYAFVVTYWIGSPAYNMSFLWFTLAFGSVLCPKGSGELQR
jgi:hypothetical protein